MKPMKRRILPFLLALALILGLSGCGSAGGTLDMQTLAEDLLKNGGFSDELWKIDDSMVQKLYNVSDYTQTLVYVGSGATAEELALFAFPSEDAAAQGLQKAQARLESQIADYRTYLPQEVPKLQNAVVKQWGSYVIVCVSPGSACEDIVARYTR